MKSAYSIEILQLKLGKHQYDFQVNGAFLRAFDADTYVDAAVQVQVELTKSNSLLDVHLQLAGTVQVPCDRCLGPYELPIAGKARIIYSYDNSLKASDADDILYLSREQPTLDLSQDIYDYIALQVPMRRVPPQAHPHQCPPEVLSLLVEEGAASQAATTAEENEASVDARWAALKGLNLDSSLQ